MGDGRWVKPGNEFQSALWLPDDCDYDPDLPDYFVRWSAEYLRWPDGFRAGEAVRWSAWQLDHLIRPMFGLVRKKDGRRAIRTVFFLSARGNGKTSWNAGVGVFGLAGMEEPAAEVDLFAVSREQAERMFRVTAAFVRQNQLLDQALDVAERSRRMRYPAGNGSLVVRSGDAKAELGLNPSMAFIDELLSQKNRELWDAVKTAMGKRPESVLITTTTPDVDVESFARTEYEYAKMVERDRGLDSSYLPVVFEAGKDDDPHDYQTWVKASPALADGFLDREVYERESNAAKLDPTKLHAFKVFRCAIWAEAGHGFLDMTQWDANAVDFGGVPLSELDCWMGIDLSSTSDLTSVCLLWWSQGEDKSDRAYALWKHYSTQAKFEELDKLTRGRWRVWSQSSAVNLEIVPGNWIDNQRVADYVVGVAETFRPESIGLDSYLSRQMFQMLGEDGEGLPVQLLSQTGRSMQAATNRVSDMVSANRLLHNGDPVARWCAANTAVKYDYQGFPKIIKMNEDQRYRIDATAALCMAMDRRLAWEREGGEFEAQAFLAEDLLADEPEGQSYVGLPVDAPVRTRPDPGGRGEEREAWNLDDPALLADDDLLDPIVVE